MQKLVKISLIFLAFIMASCSPHVYQDEVRGFANGVDDQAEALEIQAGFRANPIEAKHRELLAALDAKASELQGLIASTPNGAAEKMVAAHAKLREALEDPGTQVSEVFKAVKAFVTEAKAVRAAFATETPST